MPCPPAQLSCSTSPAPDAVQVCLRKSFGGASRLLGKVVAMASMGCSFTSNACRHTALAALGIMLLAVAMSWSDHISRECRQLRFFPSRRLNCVGSAVFRWQVLGALAVVAYMSTLAGLHGFAYDFESFTRYWLLPCVVMHIKHRAVERQHRRMEGQDNLPLESAGDVFPHVMGLMSSVNTMLYYSSHRDVIRSVPVYNLGKLSQALCETVQQELANRTLSVNRLPTRGCNRGGWWTACVGVAIAPLRVLDGIIFWERRDVALYSIVALYFVLVYLGWFFFAWTPVCVLFPLLGPKSKAAKALRELQFQLENALQGCPAGTEPVALRLTSKLNFPMATYMMVLHALACHALVGLYCGVDLVFGTVFDLRTILWALVLLCIGTVGVSVGAHDLWAHGLRPAPRWSKVLLMLFNSVGNQGSIFNWVRDHRAHHLHRGTDADPYKAHHFLCAAHLYRCVVKKKKAVVSAGSGLDLSDLHSDGAVMFQKIVDPWWSLAWCYAIPSFVALLWGENIWSAFLVAGVLRQCAQFHCVGLWQSFGCPDSRQFFAVLVDWQTFLLDGREQQQLGRLQRGQILTAAILRTSTLLWRPGGDAAWHSAEISPPSTEVDLSKVIADSLAPLRWKCMPRRDETSVSVGDSLHPDDSSLCRSPRYAAQDGAPTLASAEPHGGHFARVQAVLAQVLGVPLDAVERSSRLKQDLCLQFYDLCDAVIRTTPDITPRTLELLTRAATAGDLASLLEQASTNIGAPSGSRDQDPRDCDFCSPGFSSRTAQGAPCVACVAEVVAACFGTDSRRARRALLEEELGCDPWSRARLLADLQCRFRLPVGDCPAAASAADASELVSALQVLVDAAGSATAGKSVRFVCLEQSAPLRKRVSHSRVGGRREQISDMVLNCVRKIDPAGCRGSSLLTTDPFRRHAMFRELQQYFALPVDGDWQSARACRTVQDLVTVLTREPRLRRRRPPAQTSGGVP
mmetsp:Transcript_22517/g.49280  ORF Transcript_22517/g.49280 Transcript_22517/m.49280 type:complete len:970 (-) Transcript_22517:32-2941(-)